MVDNSESSQSAIAVSDELQPTLIGLINDLGTTIADPLFQWFQVWDFRHKADSTAFHLPKKDFHA